MGLRDLKHTRIIRNSITLFVLSVAVPLLAVSALRWRTISQFEQRKAAIHEDGFPTTIEEWIQSYAEPVGENRADWIMRAIRVFVAPDGDVQERIWVGGFADRVHPSDPISEKTRLAMRAHVQANAEAIGIIRQSMGIQESRFDFYDLDDYWEIPHIHPLLDLGRLHYNKAVLTAEEGEVDQSVEALYALFSLASSLDSEPILISQLARFQLVALGLHALEQCVNRSRFSEAQLVELQDAVSKLELAGGMVDALQGERVLLLDERSGYRDLRSGFPYGPLHISIREIDEFQKAATGSLYTPLGFWHKDAVLLLDLMERQLNGFKLPPEERLAEARGLRNQSEKPASLFVMVSLLGPAMSRVIEADAKNRAQLRAAIVALASLRYEADHGTFPDSTLQGVPAYLDAVPVDPCGGDPIRYKRLDTGFVAYSISQNLVDDGGVESDASWRNGDLTFTVKR